jgi:predicted MPP superfamily phosphohydrolase
MEKSLASTDLTIISWLHLTDLHRGMKDQEWPLLGIKDKLFDDLKRLYDKCGPWDLVLFTGDLTQQGLEPGFSKVDDFLKELWDHFGTWGFEPTLIAIPGNHDLVRPVQKKTEDLQGSELSKAQEYNEILDIRFLGVGECVMLKALK